MTKKEIIKKVSKFDIYSNGSNDQPTVCPICGSRTDFLEITKNKQKHKCMSCNYTFYLDFDK